MRIYLRHWSILFSLISSVVGCQRTELTPSIYSPPSQASSTASLVSILPTGLQTTEVVVKTSPTIKPTDWQLTAQTTTGQPITIEPGNVQSLSTFSLTAFRLSGLAIGQTYQVRLRYVYDGQDTLQTERLYQHKTPANWRRLAHLDRDGGDFTAMLLASNSDPFGTATSLLTYRYVDEQTSDRLIYQTDQDTWQLIQQPVSIPHQLLLFRLQPLMGVPSVFSGLGYQTNEMPLLTRTYLKTFPGIVPNYAGEDGEVAVILTKSQAFFLTQQGSPAFWIRDGDWSQRQGPDFPERPGTLASFTLNGIGYVVNQRVGQPTHLFAYDPMRNQWTRQADFPGPPRTWGVGFSLGSQGYYGAGITQDDERGLRDIWQYNPLLNTWRYINEYPGQGSRYLISYSTDSKAYLGWGYEYQPSLPGGSRIVGCTDFWEFTP